MLLKDEGIFDRGFIKKRDIIMPRWKKREKRKRGRKL